MKRVIGLTGPAGSGKTTASLFLKNHGYTIINVDAYNATLLERPEIIQQIESIFPSAVKEGVINRTILGDIVFQNPVELTKLNKILHPLFLKYLKDKTNGVKQYVIDMAVLFIAGAEVLCDYIIYIDASEDVRRKRLHERLDDLAKVNKLIQAQDEFQEFKNRADIVIDNSGSIEELYTQLKTILEDGK